MALSTNLKLMPTPGGHDVICSVNHPDTTQPAISSWYISSMTFYVNNGVAAELKLGPNLSQNPIIGIHLTGLIPGDRVWVTWLDTQANRGTAAEFVQ